MARGKSRTKKSGTLVESLDVEDSEKKRCIFGDTNVENTKSRGASDNEDSAGSQDDEDISIKKQDSCMVYDRTPAKRRRWEPQNPVYTAKREPRDIYTKNRMMNPLLNRRKLKGRMKATMSLILMIVVTTETMIPQKTKKIK